MRLTATGQASTTSIQIHHVHGTITLLCFETQSSQNQRHSSVKHFKLSSYLVLAANSILACHASFYFSEAAHTITLASTEFAIIKTTTYLVNTASLRFKRVIDETESSVSSTGDCTKPVSGLYKPTATPVLAHTTVTNVNNLRSAKCLPALLSTKDHVTKCNNSQLHLFTLSQTLTELSTWKRGTAQSLTTQWGTKDCYAALFT